MKGAIEEIDIQSEDHQDAINQLFQLVQTSMEGKFHGEYRTMERELRKRFDNLVRMWQNPAICGPTQCQVCPFYGSVKDAGMGCTARKRHPRPTVTEDCAYYYWRRLRMMFEGTGVQVPMVGMDAG